MKLSKELKKTIATVTLTVVITIVTIAGLAAVFIYQQIQPSKMDDVDKIVYFSADWCAPCKVYGPKLKKKAEANDVLLEEIDLTETEVYKKYHKRYGIKSLPTTWYISGQDTVVRTGATTISVK